MSKDNIDLKGLARSVQDAMQSLGYDASLGHAQEVVARTGGLANWMSVVALRRASPMRDPWLSADSSRAVLAFLLEQLHEHVGDLVESEGWCGQLVLLEDQLREALGMPSQTGFHPPSLAGMLRVMEDLRGHLNEAEDAIARHVIDRGAVPEWGLSAYFARLEDLLRMIRDAAQPRMAGQTKHDKLPGVSVTDPLTGGKTLWSLKCLSDRWGTLYENVPGYNASPARKASLDAIWGRDELGFLACKDGRLGILVEVEFASIESEEPHDPDARQTYKPHAQVIDDIRQGLVRLTSEFPGVQFCIPPESMIVHDRPAAWAFFDETCMTPEQRKVLGEELLDL